MSDKVMNYLKESPIWTPKFPHHVEPKKYELVVRSGQGEVSIEFIRNEGLILSIWSGLGMEDDYAFQMLVTSTEQIDKIEDFFRGN